MDFVTIDFETANARRESACEVGITIVENGKIQDTLSWLIRPKIMEFHWMNMKIHGITEDDVADSPEFDTVWKELKTIIGDKMLIAHNASFDMSVLRAAMNAYEIQVPKIQYGCTLKAAKAIWPRLENHKLGTLCNIHGIVNNQHHRAGNDANVTAQIALKILEEKKANDFRELSKFGVYITELQPYGENRYVNENYDFIPEKSNLDSLIELVSMPKNNNLFEGKKIVFTGELETMPRKFAQRITKLLGGDASDYVSSRTNILVVGRNDYSAFKSGSKLLSSKLKKAVLYKEGGVPIEIISEDEFLNLFSR